MNIRGSMLWNLKNSSLLRVKLVPTSELGRKQAMVMMKKKNENKELLYTKVCTFKAHVDNQYIWINLTVLGTITRRIHVDALFFFLFVLSMIVSD